MFVLPWRVTTSVCPRLTAPYVLVMAVWIILFPLMGSGPLWATQTMTTMCDSWWRNMLYINNLFPSSQEVCLKSPVLPLFIFFCKNAHADTCFICVPHMHTCFVCIKHTGFIIMCSTYAHTSHTRFKFAATYTFHMIWSIQACIPHTYTCTHRHMCTCTIARACTHTCTHAHFHVLWSSSLPVEAC